MISVETAPADATEEVAIVTEAEVVEMVQGDGTVPLAEKFEEAATVVGVPDLAEATTEPAEQSAPEPAQPQGETEARQKTDENIEKPKFRSETEPEFRARLMSAYEAHAEAALDRKDHEDALKSAKANEKAALARVESIIQKGRLSFPLFDRTAAEERAAEGEQPAATIPAELERDDVTQSVTSATTAPDGFNLDDEKTWSLIPIDELAAHGLGEKNLERLKENGITNVLEAEKLRCEVGSGALKRPKGMGEKKWTEFEESCLNWLQAKRNELAATVVAVENITPPAESASSRDDSAESVAVEPVEPTAAVNLAQQDEREIALWRRSQQVVVMSIPLSIERQQGYLDYQREKPITDCPFEPGTQQDHWLFGWHDAADSSEPEKPKAEPVAVNPTNMLGDDPLADL